MFFSRTKSQRFGHQALYRINLRRESAMCSDEHSYGPILAHGTLPAHAVPQLLNETRDLLQSSKKAFNERLQISGQL